MRKQDDCKEKKKLAKEIYKFFAHDYPPDLYEWNVDKNELKAFIHHIEKGC